MMKSMFHDGDCCVTQTTECGSPEIFGSVSSSLRRVAVGRFVSVGGSEQGVP